MAHPLLPQESMRYRFNIYVNADELARLRAKAAEARLPVSGFIRQAALAQPIHSPPSELNLTAWQSLARVAGNLKQLTHAVASGRANGVDAETIPAGFSTSSSASADTNRGQCGRTQMIAKIVKGKGFRGALNYSLNGSRGNVIGGNMAGSTPRELSSEFGQFRKLRPSVNKAVVHISLSAHPEDRPLSDVEMADIGERVASGLGYANGPYVFVRHTDTEHQHIHLLLCRVDRNGNAATDSNDFKKAEHLLKQIELDYRLKAVKPPEPKPHINKKNHKKEEIMSTPKTPETVALKAHHAEECGTLTMSCPQEGMSDTAIKKARRDALRNMLADDYEEILRKLWGHSFNIYRHPRGKIYYFDSSRTRKIEDEGLRVRAKGMSAEESATKLIALAMAKGWHSVTFSGEEDFVKEAMSQAIRAGLQIAPANIKQYEWIDEIRGRIALAELVKVPQQSSNIEAQPSNTTPKATDFPTSIKDRLHARRQALAQSQTQLQTPKSDRPRYGRY